MPEVGSCLSGGIDSSSIVTLVCEELHRSEMDTKEFKTFTACYDDSKEVDERYYSDLVVVNSDCSNIKVKPKSDKLKNDLEKIIWHQDKPFAGFGIFAGWCVMEVASKNGIKVLLDGQGGDETLLGYERYYAYMILDKIKRLDIINAAKDFKLASENSKLTKKMLLGYIIYFNNLYIRKKRLRKKNQQFLNVEFLDRFANKNIIDSSLKLNSLKEAKVHAINSSLTHLLRYEDRNTMAHSIEGRVPFLDHIFVEKAFNQGTKHKLKDGWTKAIIRKYMEDKMPMEVTYRKEKLGFSVPKDKWINELNDFYREQLLEDPVSGKYFNIENVRLAFKNNTHTDIRIKFIIIEIWMRTFIKSDAI